MIYSITCGLCGQIWQQTTASEGQVAECLFCGSRGRLCMGPLPPEFEGVPHVEVRLDSPRLQRS